MVIRELVGNLDVFLEVMEEIFYGEFFEYFLGLVILLWEEIFWL